MSENNCLKGMVIYSIAFKSFQIHCFVQKFAENVGWSGSSKLFALKKFYYKVVCKSNWLMKICIKMF